eukprot:TRINITY_DN56032_c0_g1_i1.p1 TRINITY_DN56032_c0_g1~~TRINITY_DN56032_c0_g1_i1.p1  ORF type:complete len:388 (-),score=44.14 TRINITY_DN56032_c0_g1_i1:132-1247(-)
MADAVIDVANGQEACIRKPNDENCQELTEEQKPAATLRAAKDDTTSNSSSESDSESDSDSSSDSSGSSSGSSTSSSSSSGSAGNRTSGGNLGKSRCPYSSPVQSSADGEDTSLHLKCKYAAQVAAWADHIPIGLGLCPWAGQSRTQKRLRYATCEETVLADVAQAILGEAELLSRADVPPLSTTLVVCPNAAALQDFETFDAWVKADLQQELKNKQLDDKITLVAFHPEFLRWRGLPDGVEVGSSVHSYWGTPGRKSLQTFPATIIDTSTSFFGNRKVKVRFDDGLGELYVPIEWLSCSVDSAGPVLPDNAMHRAPHPTVHLIRCSDLESLSIGQVERVKRRNAKRMMKLGWEGVERRLKQVVSQVEDGDV